MSYQTEGLPGLVDGEEEVKASVSSEARRRALLDTKARDMIRELVFHAIYISVLLVVCYGNVDQNNFRQTDTLKQLFSNINKVWWQINYWILFWNMFETEKKYFLALAVTQTQLTYSENIALLYYTYTVGFPYNTVHDNDILHTALQWLI